MINFLFNLLFFLLPLVFLPFTSELFEFNKIVLVYIFTTLIVTSWIVKSIRQKKFIFKRSVFDIPLVIFLVTQIISTIFSIDPLTSIFGYYSRLNGGLLSTICYILLYWSFVSNVSYKGLLSLIKVILLSTFIVSVYGFLEHFGKSLSCLIIINKFDTSCWVQDVATRVFATLGQPNWLAAWLVTVIPLTWFRLLPSSSTGSIIDKIARIFKNKTSVIYLGLSTLFFITILFTKSRSGLLGFVALDVIFWLSVSYINHTKKVSFRQILPAFLAVNFLLLISAAIIGTPWTKPLISQKTETVSSMSVQPALEEMGGTESGTLRKIVWEGAINLWKKYPLTGTGVETFAYSYYETRPLEHNLTSEWDFLYNKAHNEFLNFAANSGSLGLISYLLIIGFFIYQTANYIKISKRKTKEVSDSEKRYLSVALLSGFIGLLVTNFFGFSVVVTSLMFFIFPAFFVVLNKNDNNVSVGKSALERSHVVFFAATFLISGILLLAIARYWHADVLYSEARSLNDDNKLTLASDYLTTAIALNPYHPFYYSELANTYTKAALSVIGTEREELTQEFIDEAIYNLDYSLTLSPRNINLYKSSANIYTDLAQIDESYLDETVKILEKISEFAPTDPSIPYRLGLAYASKGEFSTALPFLRKAVEQKADYKKAWAAQALVYEYLDQNEMAVKIYEYILSNISPEDDFIRQKLEELTKP